ncbi:MAG: hypothetical protein AUI95_02870 [Crenarchaeota archaeon 13_1_40CM_3_52_4]|nr:MAG: hypothetical protein AUI95_02870 [Crenarchaeota archaeon 13_1_40CM_3_52_4]
MIVDQILTSSFHVLPFFRLALLLVTFLGCFLIVARMFSVFTGDDFELFENALPSYSRPYLSILKRLVVGPGTKRP